MRNRCGGFVESRLPSSTRPGLVRQARGVLVAVGAGDGVRLGSGVCEAMSKTGVEVGSDWFDGAQAVIAVRSVNSVVNSFVA